jgi:hypothetical protein
VTVTAVTPGRSASAAVTVSAAVLLLTAVQANPSTTTIRHFGGGLTIDAETGGLTVTAVGGSLTLSTEDGSIP